MSGMDVSSLTLAQKVEQVRDVLKVQSQNGNWNYDPYMQGLANGLICALSIIDGVEPVYFSAPEKWLRDAEIKCDAVKAEEEKK